jgi:predicted transcriptional regulator of viral defense system
MRAEYAFDAVIGGERRTRPADALIAALADRQHGVVARRQLGALGLGARAIDHRLQCGRLHVVHRGVYAVGHRVLSPRGRWMAAVLACGDGAVLSHRSAAALWTIRPTSRADVELTTPTQLRPRDGLLPHCAVLPADEVTTLDGIPVTTAARTLFDLAAVLTRRPLERALDEAEVLRLDGPAELLRRHPGHRGAATLRALLLDGRAPAPTRSELEERFLALVDEAGLPRPETNAIVEGYEVDAVWREARLIVELDGYATHGTRKAFERDRIRDRTLLARGWRPIRLTSRQLAADPAALAEELLCWIRR